MAWIDADAIVLCGLQGLFRRIARSPFITRENLAPEQTANPSELLHQLPFASGEPASDILLNAGVSGWCLERDRALLEGYTLRSAASSRAEPWRVMLCAGTTRDA